MLNREVAVVLAAWDGISCLTVLVLITQIAGLTGGKGLLIKVSVGLLAQLGLAPTAIPCVLLASISGAGSISCLSCLAALYAMTGIAIRHCSRWALAIQLVIAFLSIAILIAGPFSRLLHIRDGGLQIRSVFPSFALAYSCMAGLCILLLR
jgi:spore maturation protein SpmB